MEFMFFHHLGMGDHIIMNGMVRKLYKENEFTKFNLFCFYHNYDNVSYMYRDLPNFNIIRVASDYQAWVIYNNFRGKKMNNFLSIPVDYQKYNNDFCDDVFYFKMNMDKSVKKEYFHIERNEERESEVYQELTNGEDYIFVHDDTERGYVIDVNKYNPNNLKIVRADRKYKFFELLKVMEKAKEVHLISSSFLSLATCYKINNNVFAHMYMRNPHFSKYIECDYIKCL